MLKSLQLLVSATRLLIAPLFRPEKRSELMAALCCQAHVWPQQPLRWTLVIVDSRKGEWRAQGSRRHQVMWNSEPPPAVDWEQVRFLVKELGALGLQQSPAAAISEQWRRTEQKCFRGVVEQIFALSPFTQPKRRASAFSTSSSIPPPRQLSSSPACALHYADNQHRASGDQSSQQQQQQQQQQQLVSKDVVLSAGMPFIKSIPAHNTDAKRVMFKNPFCSMPEL
eukprot:371810-Pelagomonas_calceolata.AAC.2